jgi:hypothetical protein
MGGRFSLVAISNGDRGYAIIVDRYTGSAKFCLASNCRNIGEEQKTASMQQVEQPQQAQWGYIPDWIWGYIPDWDRIFGSPHQAPPVRTTVEQPPAQETRQHIPSSPEDWQKMYNACLQGAQGVAQQLKISDKQFAPTYCACLRDKAKTMTPAEWEKPLSQVTNNQCIALATKRGTG